MSAHAVFYKKVKSKPFFYYVFCALCVGVVAINIIYSQKFNSNMNNVMEGDEKSIITYLRHIWGEPLFNLEIETYKKEGKNSILSKWAEVQQENIKKIQNLENATRTYPYSPELYYNLSLLYSEKGNNIQAAENMRKARQIDPSL